MPANWKSLHPSMWILLSGILFFHFSLYMILPYIPILFSRHYGISLSVVGMILGTQSVSYLLSSLIGGWLTDRLGRKMITTFGILLQGISLILYGFVKTPLFLFMVAIASGIGGGLYTPAAKSGIAALASDENRTTAFSMRGIAANIGTTLGPLLGTFLFSFSDPLLFTVAGILCLVLVPAHIFGLKKEFSREGNNQSFLTVKQIVQDRPFLVFSGVTLFIWALFTQLNLSVPIRASEILAQTTSVGLLWTISSLLIIGTQNAITRWVSQRFHPLTTIAAGTLLLGVGLGAIAFSTRFIHLVVSVLLFTVGEMFIMPTIDSVVSHFAKRETLGSYFGMAAFVWGAGQSLGNFVGGQLMQQAEQKGTLAMPWVLFFLFGILLAGITFYLRYWNKLYIIMADSSLKWNSRLSEEIRQGVQAKIPFSFRKRIRKEK